MSIADYLLMRTPSGKLGAKKTRAAPGKISASRIALSFIGVMVGIVLSFYVTGLRPVDESSGTSAQSVQAETPASSTAKAGATPSGTVSDLSRVGMTGEFSFKRLLLVGLVSLVICALTYQGLYSSLRLYQNEPAFLILFVSFQYGYFWQSLVKGTAALVAS